MQVTNASGLTDLVKEDMVLRAEIATLIDILRIAELTEHLPEDWLSRLKQARHSETYKSIARQYDHHFAKLDHVTSREEIDEVLQHIPLLKLAE